jgi:hypothetical protein
VCVGVCLCVLACVVFFVSALLLFPLVFLVPLNPSCNRLQSLIGN